MSYDLIVVGGGPAGYVAAIRAAQLGKKAVCVEKDRAGGTCLNWGCIPTKSLLRNAELYSLMTRHAAEFGLSFDKLAYDWPKVISRSRDVSDKNAAGIEFLFKKHKIDYIRAEAFIDKAGAVTYKAPDGKSETLTAPRIMVATGVVTRPLPGLPFNGKTVIGSHDAMILQPQPKSMIIIGAGAIGIEFAYFFNSFGTKVTVVEMMPNVLPVEDTEVSQTLERSLAKQGIKIYTNTKTTTAESTDTGVKITIEGKATETLEADVCLVAIGVLPLLPGGKLKLDLTERGYIKVDDNYQTSTPGIYASGDIIGPPWLAHVASYEAVQAVNGMFGAGKPKRVTVFPGCTYCQPQVASVGLTERAAKEKGIAYKVGKFPYMASGKARAYGDTEGFVKLIVGEHGEILGAHIIGAEATELIAELGLAITLEATVDEIDDTIHAHPTLSEMVHEASEQAYGHAIHI
jgi:dihydrolipoamide dehydrogenase